MVNTQHQTTTNTPQPLALDLSSRLLLRHRYSASHRQSPIPPPPVAYSATASPPIPPPPPPVRLLRLRHRLSPDRVDARSPVQSGSRSSPPPHSLSNPPASFRSFRFWVGEGARAWANSKGVALTKTIAEADEVLFLFPVMSI
ncbi:PREDICTED: uncharacterized protein LOC109156621 [Ipomoea nil]|uniref:uncharacterized protein LOC109156621 n=1 Tax=Ipomoea nil TaxID=35883 RepID=UPI0009018A95|nr:PREDICTED: uncharacterized protein LOC109156621 [Ipomoea nil]